MNGSVDLIIAYHSSGEPTLAPRPLLHVGTVEQARMRGGRHLHRLSLIAPPRMPRLRDRGDWSPRTLARHARRSAMAVYLNRHEGIGLEEFEAARAMADIDAMPDHAFRRLLPSAADSWIVFDPDVVASVERVPQTRET
jgi:hypothetical protein